MSQTNCSLRSQISALKKGYLEKKKEIKKWEAEASQIKNRYSCFDTNLVQFKDNPSELVWEYKKLVSEISQKNIEINDIT